MAKRFLTHINLSQQSLLNAVIHPSAKNPPKPVNGQIYYNTSDKALRIYDSKGRKWRSISTIAVVSKKG
jgi:hypothetical protein